MLCILLYLIAIGHAATIFTENFNTFPPPGWILSATSVSSVTSPVKSGSALRVQNKGWAQRVVSTVGYNSITVTVNLAASSLENSIDRCLFEYSLDKGVSFYPLMQLRDGEDNSVYRTSTFSIPGAEQNANFMIRLIIRADASGDYCYADDWTVSGTAATPPTAPSMTLQTTFANLAGNGAVTRTLLTYNDITSTAQPTAPVDMSAFVVPANAAQPTNYFHGFLETLNEASVGSRTVVRDDFSYDLAPERKNMPKIYHRFIQHGSHIIPEVRVWQPSSHLYWEPIFSPGRVWNENSDNGFSRVAIPFSITQRNANCIHNGVLSFLFKSAVGGSISAISPLVYQITQETCVYFKANYWGKINVAATNIGWSGAAALRSAYESEVAGRIPTRPISQLATDYPSAGVIVSNIGSSQTAAHMTAFGVVIDGIHYRGGYNTRYGTYPYPEGMIFPSYSTSKSYAVASVPLMLKQEDSSSTIYTDTIASLVSQCPTARWGDVTIDNTLDMATGNYGLSGFEADESSTAMTNDYFLRETFGERINFMCNKYSRKSTPGTVWIYHTPDHNLAFVAMNNRLIAQRNTTVINYLNTNLDTPLGLSPTSRSCKQTYDIPSAITPWGAYGFFELADDVAKFGTFINANEGKIGTTQKFHYPTLKSLLQRDSSNVGFTANPPSSAYPGRYNGGFWATDVYAGAYTSQGCASLYEPYMSGYGGIGVHLLKNKAVYYFVSDNEEYGSAPSILELAKIRNPCTTTYSP